MTVRTGYDPERIRLLARRTAESIDALASVRSEEPVADEAVRAARAARRDLEEVWMPLLREIESSDAMIAWRHSSVAGLRDEWSATGAWLGHLPVHDLGDDDLLDEIALLDEVVPVVHDESSSAEFDRWLATQRGLAHELARRVSADPAFATDLTAAAYGSPVVGLLVALTSFPADFRADLLTATLADPWWESGWEMDKYAGAANTLIESLLDDPRRCLDVIGREGAAPALAGWSPLDQDLVGTFVHRALFVAPGADATLLPAGHESVRAFVRLANRSPFDAEGFEAGVATGLASSMGGYLPTFVEALEDEHAPVVARSHGVGHPYDFTFGTREEMVDFFGAMTRSPAAQVELGVALDAAIRDALGPRPQVTIGAAAEFAELLDLAAENEDEELGIAAAARRTSLLRAGALIGMGIAVGATAAGLGAGHRSSADRLSSSIVDTAARAVGADAVGVARLRPIAYQSIQIEACRRFVTDPDVRAAAGAPALGAGVLRSLDTHLAGVVSLVDAADADPGVRRRAIVNLVEAVRDAGGGDHLDAILEENSVDALAEADHDADLGDR